RHTRFSRDWSSDVCSSDLGAQNDLALLFAQRNGGAPGLGAADGGGAAFPTPGPGPELARVRIDRGQGEHVRVAPIVGQGQTQLSSEERRVGKEWGTRWADG